MRKEDAAQGKIRELETLIERRNIQLYDKDVIINEKIEQNEDL